METKRCVFCGWGVQNGRCVCGMLVEVEVESQPPKPIEEVAPPEEIVRCEFCGEPKPVKGFCCALAADKWIKGLHEPVQSSVNQSAPIGYWIGQSFIEYRPKPPEPIRKVDKKEWLPLPARPAPKDTEPPGTRITDPWSKMRPKLIDLWNRGVIVAKIADELNCSEQYVRRLARSIGLPRRRHGRKPEQTEIETV
jgi:hypothetical protein